jgi:predicted NAD-dependent protein-ADP-ribosyltransferase YbiA (DUF1768 family)
MDLKQDILKFYSKSKTGKCLSNFYECDIKIYNKEYISGEHAFHGMKYFIIANNIDCPKRKKELLDYCKKFESNNTEFKTPNDAKIAGGKRGLFLMENEKKIWNEKSYDIQKEISNYKIQKYPEIRQFLKDNKNKYILHQDNRATEKTIWGGNS